MAARLPALALLATTALLTGCAHGALIQPRVADSGGAQLVAHIAVDGSSNVSQRELRAGARSIESIAAYGTKTAVVASATVQRGCQPNITVIVDHKPAVGARYLLDGDAAQIVYQEHCRGEEVFRSWISTAGILTIDAVDDNGRVSFSISDATMTPDAGVNPARGTFRLVGSAQQVSFPVT